ncbi:hypothetical protein MKX03_011782, partial [Papaver bracteatum]
CENIEFSHELKDPVEGDFEKTLISPINQKSKLERMQIVVIGLEMENIALI